MSTIYTDPIIEKYQELIEAAMPGFFRGKYQGDPVRIPKSNLPALIISKSQSAVSPLTNSEDDHLLSFVLTIVTDIRDERSDDVEMTPGIAALYDIIEGRDANYKLKSNTILDVLRDNITVDASLNLRTDLGSSTRVDYGMTIGKRQPEAYAIEAQVEFTARYSQLR